MILIENTQITGLEPTIRGMRNPMNSWAKSDSGIGCYSNQCSKCGFKTDWCGNTPQYIIGPNDHDLMLRLAKAGSVDGKFRRMIAVYIDITAPLYWWKEFDTYKVGTVANSCSTMHKIHSKPFTLDDFSHEQLLGEGCIPDHAYQNSRDVLNLTIESLNFWRGIFVGEITGEGIEKGDKRAWWQMIQLLPSSYNQKRTVMLNYEVLANIYQHRHNHKLDEWRELCRWIESLPYSDIIICNTVKQEELNSIMAAIARLKGEEWSTENIVALLLGQSQKEQLKSFADSGDARPVHIHGGIFDMPDLTAGNAPKES